MFKKALKIFTSLKRIFNFNFILTKDEREFRKTFNKNTTTLTKGHSNEDVLLVPLINDLGTMKVIIKAASVIATQENMKIKYFFVHTAIDNKPASKKSLLHLLSNRVNNWSYFSIRRLRRIYAISPEDLVMSNYFALCQNTSKNVNKFHSKPDVLSLEHNDIQLGELLYDTYLRFRSKPTVDIHDDDLYLMKDYMIRLSDEWDEYFGANKIAKLLIPYMSYHHWGIPGKTALKHNVEVITFGSYLYILQKMSPEYSYHTKNFNLYREIFQSITNKEPCLKEANAILEKRLSGVIDKGTSYMKNSAFGNKNKLSSNFPEDNKWAVIFLHCFFDSPHVYGDGLFVDFYEWLTYLLTKASQNPHVTYFVKSHPNGLPENVLVVDAFIEKFSKFSNIIFLSKEVSNSQIIESRPGAIFTYYGTVAHEFAYCGIPAVTCGENPHSKYEFVYNTKSINELDFFLENVGKFGLPDKYNKEEILEFFYMHYIYYSPKYDQLNFDLGKNMEIGDINIPADAIIDDLIYRK